MALNDISRVIAAAGNLPLASSPIDWDGIDGLTALNALQAAFPKGLTHGL